MHLDDKEYENERRFKEVVNLIGACASIITPVLVALKPSPTTGNDLIFCAVALAMGLWCLYEWNFWKRRH